MKYKCMIFAIIIAVAFLGCNGSSGSSEKQEVNFSRDASYALGLNIGSGLKDGLAADGVYPNINEFIKGMRDGLSGANPRFDLDQAREIINASFEALQEENREEARQAEIVFLAENARKPGINITPSGLQYEVLTPATGPKPTEENSVVVHYDGKFTNDRVFDSSYTRGNPVTFNFDELIPGMVEGLMLMSPGAKYRLFIPSEIGYGEDGMSNPWTGEQIIPQFATLIFEIELLEITPRQERE